VFTVRRSRGLDCTPHFSMYGLLLVVTEHAMSECECDWQTWQWIIPTTHPDLDTFSVRGVLLAHGTVPTVTQHHWTSYSRALVPSDLSALLSWSISGRARNLSHISSLASSMLPTASPPLPPTIPCDSIRYVGPPTEKRTVWSYPQDVVLFGNDYPQTVRNFECHPQRVTLFECYRQKVVFVESHPQKFLKVTVLPTKRWFSFNATHTKVFCF